MVLTRRVVALVGVMFLVGAAALVVHAGRNLHVALFFVGLWCAAMAGAALSLAAIMDGPEQ
jgi:hypothetical protein